MLKLQAWYDTEQMRAKWDEVDVELYPPLKELVKLREAELALLEKQNVGVEN